ncbi:MAG: small basic family protein [Bacillota bacterium]|jgi:small basic protein
MWLPVLFLVIGLIAGRAISFSIPPFLATYMSVALLAALDSVLGGIKAMLEGEFDNLIFLTGFFSNALLAAGLAFLGDQLGVNLYMAAVFAFGVRLFQNLGVVRRLLIGRYRRR